MYSDKKEMRLKDYIQQFFFVAIELCLPALSHFLPLDTIPQVYIQQRSELSMALNLSVNLPHLSKRFDQHTEEHRAKEYTVHKGKTCHKQLCLEVRGHDMSKC